MVDYDLDSETRLAVYEERRLRRARNTRALAAFGLVIATVAVIIALR